MAFQELNRYLKDKEKLGRSVFKFSAICNFEHCTEMGQEIEGLQVRHLQLSSCLHFMGHEKVGFRHDT